MPLNPNIALSAKNIELQDPLVQYGKMAAIQSAQNQNALAQYQLGTAQRAETAQNVLADAYAKSVDPVTGKIDYNKLNSLVAAGGGGAQLPAIQKSRMEQETAALTQQETGFKVQKAKKDFIAQAQRDTSQNPSDANITAYKEDLIANPLFSEQEKQQMIASSDRLLAMPINERKTFMSSQGATASELKPTVSVGRTGIVQTPAFGGAATVVPGTGEAFKATPGEAMADARARAQMAQSERQFGIAQANQGKAPAAAEKPLTEAQGKATGFALRAKEADEVLKKISYSPAAVATKQAMEGYPVIGGVLGASTNVMLPEQAQQADQAQRSFVNAILRQESGAAISESEFQNARKQYFPQPGDGKTVIEQKKKNRETAIRALETAAGPGMGRVVPAAPAAAPSNIEALLDKYK